MGPLNLPTDLLSCFWSGHFLLGFWVARPGLLDPRASLLAYDAPNSSLYFKSGTESVWVQFTTALFPWLSFLSALFKDIFDHIVSRVISSLTSAISLSYTKVCSWVSGMSCGVIGGGFFCLHVLTLAIPITTLLNLLKRKVNHKSLGTF